MRFIFLQRAELLNCTSLALVLSLDEILFPYVALALALESVWKRRVCLLAGGAPAMSIGCPGTSCVKAGWLLKGRRYLSCAWRGLRASDIQAVTETFECCVRSEPLSFKSQAASGRVTSVGRGRFAAVVRDFTCRIYSPAPHFTPFERLIGKSIPPASNRSTSYTVTK